MAPTIVPDSKYPGMYRIRYADGSSSDLLNLARAKDALAGFGAARPERRQDRARLQEMLLALDARSGAAATYHQRIALGSSQTCTGRPP
jgi:hypothetical protein